MISRGVIRNAASQLNHRLSRIRSESSSLRSQSGAGAELFRKAKEIVYEVGFMDGFVCIKGCIC